jgi:hypothetical protein
VRARRLAVAAVAALATIPFAGAMAASPGLSDLPQALANPLEPSFVEITSNRSGELVGYFDAGAFAQWAGTDASSRQDFRDMLTSREFVSGYQRIWTTNDHEALFETVFVFRTAPDADSMLDSVKSGFVTSSDYKGPVTIDLNDTAWAGQEIVNGFHWTAAGFTKSNDAFVLYRGSDADYRTSAAVAQASEMYTVAPNGTALVSQGQRQQSALSRYIMPVMITFVLGALLITAALVIAVVVAVTSRPTPVELRT